MSTILVIFYLLLFVVSFFNVKIRAFATPIFTFVYPKQLSALKFGDADLSMIFLFIVGVKLIIEKRQRHLCNSQKRWYDSLLLYFIVIYIGTQLFSLFFIPGSEYMNCLKSIIEGILCCFAVLTMYFILVEDKNYDYLIIGLFFSILLESVVAIGLMINFDAFSMFYSGKEFNDISSYFRATGTFNGPWALGGFLSIAIIFIFYYLFLQKCNNLLKIFLIIASCLSVYALILTGSRAGWLLLTIGIIYLAARGNTVIIKGLLYMVVVSIIAISYWGNWDEISFLVSHRIENTYNNNVTGGIDGSSLERVHIWEKVIENYNPMYLITGYGIRNAYNIFGSTTHNSFLSLFIYCGIIGYYIIIKFLHEGFILVRKNSIDAQRFFVATLMGVGAYCLSADLLFDIRVFSLLLIVLTFYLLKPTIKK